VGRLPDGKACFVPDVCLGERVSISIEKDAKRMAEGILVAVESASPDRVEPRCRYFGECGGCAYQHMDYAAQLEVKRRQVGQVLGRIGGFRDMVVEAPVGAPEPFEYRNRITVHARGGRVGFYRRDGRGIMDIERCLLASEVVNEKLAGLRERVPEDSVRTLREHEERRGFHQTNDAVAALLRDGVLAACASGGSLLIDAYCGAGFFAHPLASRFERVVGIEWNGESVALAREAAALNEIYLEGDVAAHLEGVLSGEDAAGATVILDPPAQGVDARVAELLAERRVAQIVYVSCDPGTLARDLKRMSAAYELKSVKPFDMFPQTAEIEVMAVLTGAR